MGQRRIVVRIWVGRVVGGTAEDSKIKRMGTQAICDTSSSSLGVENGSNLNWLHVAILYASEISREEPRVGPCQHTQCSDQAGQKR